MTCGTDSKFWHRKMMSEKHLISFHLFFMNSKSWKQEPYSCYQISLPAILSVYYRQTTSVWFLRAHFSHPAVSRAWLRQLLILVRSHSGTFETLLPGPEHFSQGTGCIFSQEELILLPPSRKKNGNLKKAQRKCYFKHAHLQESHRIQGTSLW